MTDIDSHHSLELPEDIVRAEILPMLSIVTLLRGSLTSRYGCDFWLGAGDQSQFVLRRVASAYGTDVVDAMTRCTLKTWAYKTVLCPFLEPLDNGDPDVADLHHPDSILVRCYRSDREPVSRRVHLTKILSNLWFDNLIERLSLVMRRRRVTPYQLPKAAVDLVHTLVARHHMTTAPDILCTWTGSDAEALLNEKLGKIGKVEKVLQSVLRAAELRVVLRVDGESARGPFKHIAFKDYGDGKNAHSNLALARTEKAARFMLSWTVCLSRIRKRAIEYHDGLVKIIARLISDLQGDTTEAVKLESEYPTLHPEVVSDATEWMLSSMTWCAVNDKYYGDPHVRSMIGVPSRGNHDPYTVIKNEYGSCYTT